MNWEDIKNSKEDSLRESLGNPRKKPFEINGVKYNSYAEYLQSDEYKQFLDLEIEALAKYTELAKDFFNSLDTDNQLLVFFHITNCIYENYFRGSGSYRALLYERLGFGPEAYSIGLDSGMFHVHNSISTPDEDEERFVKLVEHLKLDLSKKELRSLRHIFLYGFDSTKSMDDLSGGQLRFEFY